MQFELMPDDFSMYDAAMNWIVEPGMFDVMIGSSSEDIRLQGPFEVVKSVGIGNLVLETGGILI